MGIEQPRIETDTAPETTPTPPEVTMDNLYFALSNHRRRFVLDYLMRVTDTEGLRTLSAELAAWENGIALDQTTAVQRKRAYVSLHQNHLPKLHDLGLVRYDKSRGVTTLSEDVEALDLYLEVAPKDEIPWSYFYLGLGGMSCVLVAAMGFGLAPFDRLPALTVAAIVSVTFATTAAIHAVHTARSRIGTGINLL